MSEDRRIYTSLDIGSTSVKVLIAEVNHHHTSILGVGNALSRGIKRGVIVDIDQAVDAIKAAVRQAEEKAGIEIQNVIVGVPNYQLDIIQSHGVVEVGENNEIGTDDIKNVLQQMMVQSIPPEKQVMSVLAEEFIVDGFNDIQDPRGMVGVRLELSGYILSLPKIIIQSIAKVVEKAGYVVSYFVLQSLALATLTLSNNEKRDGAVMIDFGGGQTTAAVMHNDKLKYTTVDPEGGNNVTKDISIVLNINTKVAEKIKQSHGFASSLLANEADKLTIHPINSEQEQEISEKYLSEIIEARFIQIIEHLRTQLDEVGALDFPSSVVVSGGSAMLPGVKELCEEILQKTVRLYTPNYMGIRHASFSTALGLINYISEREDIHTLIDSIINASVIDSSAPLDTSLEDYETQSNRNKKQAAYEKYVVEEGEDTLLDRVKSFFSSFFE